METLLARLPVRPQPLPVRLVATTAIMAVAITLQFVVGRLTGLPGLFVLLAGIFIIAAAFDRGCGIYASVLATAAGFPIIHHFYGGIKILPAMTVFFGICLAVTLFSAALREAMERAHKSEREKDFMLHELTHRMQNNLALAASLLDLQGRSHTNPEVRAAMIHAMDRLSILAEGQRHLQLQSAGLVEMQGYLGQVCGHLSRSVGAARAIDFTFKIEPISLPGDKALVIGLLANELVTNAIKYAFGDNQKGTITVAFSRNAAGELELSVADNGVGCPDDAINGFGTRLVEGLTAQHGGGSQRRNMVPGCRVDVVIPDDPAALRI
jgi:two-component sensor histidine kinase